MQSTASKLLGTGRTTALLVLATVFFAGTAQAAQDCKRPPGAKTLAPKVVAFDLGSKAISEKDDLQLKEMAARYAGNPNIEVCLVGMTDRSGDPAANKKLALERAEAVATVLKANGLSDNKYQMIARGQAYTDDSWLGKLIGTEPAAGDRRVDVILMER